MAHKLVRPRNAVEEIDVPDPLEWPVDEAGHEIGRSALEGDKSAIGTHHRKLTVGIPPVGRGTRGPRDHHIRAGDSVEKEEILKRQRVDLAGYQIRGSTAEGNEPSIPANAEAGAAIEGATEMIPPFDEHGYLPPDVYAATFEETLHTLNAAVHLLTNRVQSKAA